MFIKMAAQQEVQLLYKIVGNSYNSGNEKSVADTWTPSKYEAGTYFSKDESQVDPHIPTKDIRNFEEYQGVSPTPRRKFRKDTSSKWH